MGMLPMRPFVKPKSNEKNIGYPSPDKYGRPLGIAHNNNKGMSKTRHPAKINMFVFDQLWRTDAKI